MLPRYKLLRGIDADSLLLSTILCVFILLYFIQTSEQFVHWFVIPVTLCGILIGMDAINWFRGHLKLFDPVGIVGLVGIHFFFLAPLLHIHWNYWMGLGTPAVEWRPWLGAMATLNFLGLWVYRLFREIVSSPAEQGHQPYQTVWRLNTKQFPVVLAFGLFLSFALQALAYQRYGGIVGYITSATSHVVEARDEFKGMGMWFVLSESFPILAMMGFTALAHKNKKLQSGPILILVIVIFFILKLLFGGLRGSRSVTIWATFWAVGMIHLWIRPVSRKTIAVGLVCLLVFMYIYGFFKANGIEGLTTAITASHEERVVLEETTGRSWENMLLGDLGRSDIQAFVLYRITRPDNDYNYAFGRTYLAAPTILIPRSIWVNRPPDKNKEGTDVQDGEGAYVPGIWESSRVFGLAGEAMLNFGPFSVPLPFAIFGILVGRVRHWLLNWDPSDTRILMLPMLINFCFVFLVSDLDNNIVFLISQGSLPFFVIWFGSHQVRQNKKFLPIQNKVFPLV